MSEETAAAPAPAPEAKPARPPLVLPRGKARVGLIATMVFLLIGFVSLIWTPWPVDQPDVSMQLLDPSFGHLLGTDGQGRDVLSLIMKGVLTSYVVAAIGVAIGLIAGVPLGLLAAVLEPLRAQLARWTGGPVAAIPVLAIAIVVATLAGPSPVVAMAAIGIATIPIIARATWRVAAARHRKGQMDLSRLAGMTRWEAITRHVLPTIPATLLARSVTLIGFAVLAEAALAYAGLGAQPTGMSLGLMLRDAQGMALFEPILFLAPGIAITLIAAALQLAGRGLAEGLDGRVTSEVHDDALA